MKKRADGRAADALRPLRIVTGYLHHAEGSALVELGRTRVLCAASIEDKVPPFLEGKGEGWITAEYGMLPRATHSRSPREAARGKQGGRTMEIQRLVGRSLRTIVDRKALGARTLTIDCDVIEADGGTRSAAVTGGAVAVALALARLVEGGALQATPLRGMVAAVSVGMVDGEARLDLDYQDDSRAEVDFNVVRTSDGRYVEVQGTAEKEPFDDRMLARLLELAARGIGTILAAQREALRGARVAGFAG